MSFFTTTPDVIIKCSDKDLYCHSEQLKRCIYFQAALQPYWQKEFNGKIQLQHTETHSSVMQVILNFIYTGNVDIPSDADIPKLLESCDFLCLPKLFHEVFKCVSRENAVNVFKTVFSLNKFSYAIAALRFFGDFKYLVPTFSLEMMLFFIQSVNGDEERWRLVMLWDKNHAETLALLQTLVQAYITFQFTEYEYKTLVVPFLDSCTDYHIKSQLTLIALEFKALQIQPTIILSKTYSVIPNEPLFRKAINEISCVIIQNEKGLETLGSRIQDSIKARVSSSDGPDYIVGWNLIYSASECDFCPKAFRARCSDSGPTVTLVLSENGKVGAAYNCQDWIECGSGWSSNQKGFISSISGDKISIFNRGKDRFGVYNRSDLGPCFGSYNGDLDLANGKMGYSFLGNSYVGPGASETRLFGSSSFAVQEYEVYSITISST